MSKIILADRIKELSYSVGTGDFILNGAMQGFSPFSSSYNYGDIVYYAISDSVNYEIGSGQYLFSSPNNIIRRYPFKSTNSNNKVNFTAGTKEVFVTYPGQKAVFTASNFGTFSSPQRSGIAFWGSDQILDYDSAFVWDAINNRLGINRSIPSYAVDVGGVTNDALVRASGFITGASGITFPQGLVYSGGQQFEPFIRNQLDVLTGTNSVFSLSGVVGQGLLFKQQVSRTLLMGPPSGSGPNYPSFRALLVDDLPDLSSTYVRQTGVGTLNSVAIYKDPRIIGFDSYLVWDDVNNYLGVNKQVPTKSLDVVGNAQIIGTLTVNSGIELPSGVPVNITNKLYNIGNQLYFNGGPIIGGSGGAGTYNWNISDSIGNTETVANTNTVYFSGGGGVSVSYNSATNVMLVSGAPVTTGVVLVSGNQSISGVKTFYGTLDLNVTYLTGNPIVVHSASGNKFAVNLSGPTTIQNPIGFNDGRTLLFRLRQSPNGTVTWGDQYRFLGNLSGLTLSTISGYEDRFGFEYNATDAKWDCVSYSTFTDIEGFDSTGNLLQVSGISSSAFIQSSGAFVSINNASFPLSGIYNGKTLLVSGASQINVTVSGNLPLGFGVAVIQTGPGAVFYSGAPGINIRNRQGHTRSNGLWSATSLVQFSGGAFLLAGDTTT